MLTKLRQALRARHERQARLNQCLRTIEHEYLHRQELRRVERAYDDSLRRLERQRTDTIEHENFNTACRQAIALEGQS